jgi:hypothetical protein
MTLQTGYQLDTPVTSSSNGIFAAGASNVVFGDSYCSHCIIHCSIDWKSVIWRWDEIRAVASQAKKLIDLAPGIRSLLKKRPVQDIKKFYLLALTKIPANMY